MKRPDILFAIVLMLAGLCPVIGQTVGDKEIAARFAPVFYQALGDKRRGDYITNFDFDGDWRGDNNWKNADDPKFPLLGYVYYAVSETQTHYFVHYAVFHPRDYKGGEKRGVLLSDLIREGVRMAGKNDPTGLAAEATAAHENDMEGALVVAEKSGSDLSRSKVVYVETLHHNTFTPYALKDAMPESNSTVPGVFRKDGENVLLYVEPKGHGIEAYSADEKQTGGKEFLIYKFAGRAGDPEKQSEGKVDYDLLPIAATLWPKAKAAVKNTTYGVFHDYGVITINVAGPKGVETAKKIQVGKLASSFLGSTGGVNMARPPWGWFSSNERKDPLGSWFFDPARIIKRDFGLDETFSTAYTRLPFWATK